MNKWQTIDTAPENGTEVELFGSNGNTFAMWGDDENAWYDQHGYRVDGATHWRPKSSPLEPEIPTGDIEIMSYMAQNDMDIAGCYTVVSAQSNKQGGTIAMGVGNPQFTEFMLQQGKYIPVLFLINSKQFWELKNKGKNEKSNS